MGIVFQSDRLVDDLSALENVFLPLLPRGYPLAECRQLAMSALGRLQVDGLATETTSTRLTTSRSNVRGVVS